MFYGTVPAQPASMYVHMYLASTTFVGLLLHLWDGVDAARIIIAFQTHTSVLCSPERIVSVFMTWVESVDSAGSAVHAEMYDIFVE